MRETPEIYTEVNLQSGITLFTIATISENVGGPIGFLTLNSHPLSNSSHSFATFGRYSTHPGVLYLPPKDKKPATVTPSTNTDDNFEPASLGLD